MANVAATNNTGLEVPHELIQIQAYVLWEEQGKPEGLSPDQQLVRAASLLTVPVGISTTGGARRFVAAPPRAHTRPSAATRTPRRCAGRARRVGATPDGRTPLGAPHRKRSTRPRTSWSRSCKTAVPSTTSGPASTSVRKATQRSRFFPAALRTVATCSTPTVPVQLSITAARVPSLSPSLHAGSPRL